MSLSLVSYDIAEKNHDYGPLWDDLKTLGAVRILYSEWATPCYGKALQLVDQLERHPMKATGLWPVNFSIPHRLPGQI
jgi:hypothetical protein